MPALPIVGPKLDGRFQRHPGDIGVQQHHPLALGGVTRCIRVRDPGADVVARQCIARQAHGVEQGAQPLAGGARIVAIQWLVRIPLPRQVHREHAKMRG
ncbi:hypothetical protein G6F46_015342 [Rhizopus delemar]|nr:hypothetical protein G6F46_015342 [Rhizopus delemar]